MVLPLTIAVTTSLLSRLGELLAMFCWKEKYHCISDLVT